MGPCGGERGADSGGAFEAEMLRIGGKLLRAGRRPGSTRGRPLLMFNGIGGNIELLEPFARCLSGRELITFDVPGVGHSELPARPYRLRTVAALACGILDHYGHHAADVLGVSWGGAAAQQFARNHPQRCGALVLCATSAGVFMVPSHPRVALKMATPRRFTCPAYARRVSGDIYGGDFRSTPSLAEAHFKHVRWQSPLGYFLQLAAVAGWTSAHWLHRLRQPTLVMAGHDDPLVPLINARLLRALIPNCELEVVDCGHLFLLTRAERCAARIEGFLDRHRVGSANH
jgi:poly(3-hydroxyalkanoate) depolymerase